MRRGVTIAMGLCTALIAFLAFAGESAPACASGACEAALVYVGTRGQGPGSGIFAARFDAESGDLTSLGLAAELARSTWLLAHPNLPVLYSVSEVGESKVHSFAVDPATGGLRELNSVSSGGNGATHLAIDEVSNSLFVALYGSGQTSWLPIQQDGSLGMPLAVQSHYGTGPNRRRQSSPHAHGVAVDPTKRFVLSADLGADRIFMYRFDAATRQMTPAEPAFAAAAAGSGPRHLVFHPNGKFLYLAAELTSEVVTYRWEPQQARLQHVQTLPTDAPDYRGDTSVSEIEVSRDGKYVYVGNRGQDLIVVYSTNERTGALTEVQRISAQGRTPWSFVIHRSGRWMLVANHGSNSVAVFKRDPATGKLSAAPSTLEVPEPSSVTFVVDPT